MIKMRVQAVEVLRILRHSRATFIIIINSEKFAGLSRSHVFIINKHVITYFNVLHVLFIILLRMRAHFGHI